MFEKEEILNEFLKNISQCTAINGYFIGCCFDGKKIFKMLESIENNESISLFKNSKKIWQITKKYDFKNFDNDESSLGYVIDIYQESINKTIREYLVNFDYLVRILENYGFVVLSDSELKDINMPSSITSFEIMYNQMIYKSEINKEFKYQIGNSLNMSNEEKQISFLNDCFVFKKVRNVSNIPSLIKNNEYDEKNKMDSLNYDKRKLDEEIEKITDANIEFKTTSKKQKNKKQKNKKQKNQKQKNKKKELETKEEQELVDEKIKLVKEKKKQNYQKKKKNKK